MDLNLYNTSELVKVETAADGREAVCGDKELNDGTKSEATEKNVRAKIERRGTKKTSGLCAAGNRKDFEDTRQRKRGYFNIIFIFIHFGIVNSFFYDFNS